LNSEKIVEKLETKWLGREMVCLDEVDSTNSYAVRLLAEGKLRHGMVITADSQYGGRGRMGRSWYSNGGICMTAVLITDKPPAELAPVTLAAGVGMAVGIRSLTGYDFKLKYPNDVMAGDKKLGGILSELKLSEGKSVVLLGIGLNVEQLSFPDEIKDIAVSLKSLGFDIDRENVTASVINGLEKTLEIFIEEGFPKVRPFWIDINCTLGKEISVEAPSGHIEGRAVNLDDDGALVVETQKGLQKVTTGDFLIRTVP